MKWPNDYGNISTLRVGKRNRKETISFPSYSIYPIKMILLQIADLLSRSVFRVDGQDLVGILLGESLVLAIEEGI